MSLQTLFNDLDTQLSNSSIERKGDVADAAAVLQDAAGLTMPDFSGYSNSGTVDPPVPPLKDIPDTDPVDVQVCKIKAGIKMLRCYITNPDNAEQCEETYCEEFEACEINP